MAQINSKEIQKSLQDDVNARKDGTEKLKHFADEVEKAADKQKEARFELEQLQMSYEKDIKSGHSIRELDNAIMKAKTRTLNTDMQKAKADDAKKDFDDKYQQESIDILNKIGDNVLKVSPEEMELRKAFQESINIEKEQLAMLEADPLRQDQAEALKRNIDAKEEKEKKRRDDAQTKGFQKGFKGISDGLKNFGEGLKTTAALTLKGGLLIAAYFAIAKFLQSPMFGQLLSFIKENIIPAFTAFADYFMKPGGLFDSLKRLFGGLMDIVGGIFKIITGIFTGDGSKILEGFRGIFSGLAEVIGGIGEAVFGIVVDLGKGLINLIVGVVKGIFNLIIDAITGVFNFMDNLTGGMYTNIMSTIMSAVEMFTGGFTKIFSGDILGGLADIIISPFKMIGELAANVFKGMIDTILSVVNLIPGVNVKNPFDEVPKPSSETDISDNIAKTGEIMSGGEKDPARFVTNKQNEDMMMRRKEEMMDEKRAVNNVNNQTVVNNVSTGGTTQQINSTRYVKDQTNVFQSNNA